MSNHPEAALRALAEHGLRCDMNPTHDMSSLDASETFWHGYLRMLDANVRQLATNALAAPSPPDSSQGEPVAWLHDVVQNDGSGEQNDQALSFSPDNFPLEGEAPYLWRSLGSKPLYTHPSSPQFADGYAIVPLEPTQAMKDAWAQYKINCANSGTQRTAGGHYRAMIAAAPQLPNFIYPYYTVAKGEPPGVDWEHGRYPGKITQHWLRVAFGRIAAGEPEREVLFDYGYVPEKAADDEPLFTVSMYGTSAAADKAREEWLAAKGEPQWQPMETAPKDGTLVLLLVKDDDSDELNPLEDELESRTIGSYGVHGGPEADPEWSFAGWCWDFDMFEDGCGMPIAWAPLLPTPEQRARSLAQAEQAAKGDK